MSCRLESGDAKVAGGLGLTKDDMSGLPQIRYQLVLVKTRLLSQNKTICSPQNALDPAWRLL